MTMTRRRFVAVSGAVAATAGASLSADERIVSLANSRREELIDLLSALIRVQSLSGESAEYAQQVVKDYLRDLPYRIEESADRPSRYEDHAEYMPPNPPSDGPFVNIIGWPENPSGRQSAMFSHIDTHSLDAGWETDPLTPVIDGNRMIGLGTSDDKGGVAAMLVASSILASERVPLPVVMSLHGKGGGSRGSLPVFDRLSKTDHGINAVLYVHPAETGRGLDDIKNAVQGVVDFELTVRGWRSPPMEIGSVDSSDWATGGNALDKCWALIEHLRNNAFRDTEFNLGIMDGGNRVGSVADEASARFRLKFTGDLTWRELFETASADLREVVSDPWQASLNLAGYRTNPGEAEWSLPVSRTLRSAIEEVTGRAPDAYPNHYAGDIRYPIRLLGVPAYGIGSTGGNFYGPNEWVDIDDLVNLVAVLVTTLRGWSA
ncbi:MAG: M20/M25/M40 family metallo-hydrolase [Woeseiaceae bacterium]|nr:M20/M25/M40 family metallo-hydrolase [Woeseiaceae bacterium]